MKYLFIIDPQNDFIEGGSLPVSGGKEALQRIVDSGILDRKDWGKIIVSLDSHNPSHLGFGEPKTDLRKHLLRGTKRPTKWPPHCVIDTPGWEIYGPLQEKLLSLGDKVVYIEKGQSDLEDSYSILDTPDLEKLIECFSDDPTDEFYWTGLAEDYCIYESIKEVSEINQDCSTLFSDMTACIKNHISEDEGLRIKPYTENS